MRNRGLLHIVLCFLAVPLVGAGQNPLSVSETLLEHHVLHRAPLIYPDDARQAQIQGTVVLQVQIGVTGSVVSMKAISGPPTLTQAAIDCVGQWTYRPFTKNGSPVVASGKVSINFTLQGVADPSGKQPPKGHPGRSSMSVIVLKPHYGFAAQPDEDAARKYILVRNACTRSVMAGNRDESTAMVCAKAATMTDQFLPGHGWFERQLAFVNAATAFENCGNLQEALAYASKAVDLVRSGHGFEDGDSSSYFSKGMVEAASHDLSAADHDLTASEDYERKAISWSEREAPRVCQEYKSHLASELRFHAQVLRQMKHHDEAQAKLDEASALAAQ